jgi:hypothetical protein
MKPRRLAVYGLTAGLLGGGVAGMALTGTTLASTRIADVSSGTTDSTVVDTGSVTDPLTSSTTSDTTAVDSGATTTTNAPATTTTSDPAASDPSTTTTTSAPAAPATPAPATGSAKPTKGDWAKSALDPLVTNGTISQAQEDAVLAALKTGKPGHGPGDGHGRGGPGFGKLDVVANALGMTVDELRTALDGGKTIAGIASDKGIALSKITDALVAELKTHLAEEVTEGDITQAQADQLLANAKTGIDDFVNGKVPAGGPGDGGRGFGGPGGGRGHHGPGGGGGAPASGSNGSGSSGSSGSSGTTTTS